MVGGIKRTVKQAAEEDRHRQLALERMAALRAEEERAAASRASNESESNSKSGAEAGPSESRSGKHNFATLFNCKTFKPNAVFVFSGGVS